MVFGGVGTKWQYSLLQFLGGFIEPSGRTPKYWPGNIFDSSKIEAAVHVD